MTLFLFVLASDAFSQKIARIEPPNWWVGMKNTELQLMLYGENIAHLKPQINYEGVRIKSTISVKNPNYLFLYLEINPTTQAGTLKVELKDKNDMVQTFDYDLKKRTENELKTFNTTDVMYLITPDRFANGNSENDNLKDMPDKLNRKDDFGRHGGDLKGISDHLGYISEMGFTAIWVNPMLENNMPQYSYHGYATTDFYKIDARFGTNEEYQKFCQKANAKGIKIIMDMIVNHCGSEHWFVKDLPTDDWLNFQNQEIDTHHRRHVNQDIHASEYDKKRFTDGWFSRGMPDLNQRNPLMADYLIQNTIWWIEYVQLNGIRMDTYPYPDKYFMTDWTCKILEEYPDFNIVGEEWSTNPAIVSYWQANKNNHDNYRSCLPSVMDFPLQDALAKGLMAEEKLYGSGMITMYEMLALDFLYADADNLVIFPDNHDMDRFYTQVGKNFDLFKMGISYILTMRGIPQIYYGTEILMDNSDALNDHGVIRTDFAGGWQGDKVNAFTGKGLTNRQKEAQNFMKTLLHWRKNAKAIHHGKLTQFAPHQGIYVYFRHTDSEKVMVIFNKNKEKISLEMPRYAELLHDVQSAKDALSAQTFDLKEGIEIPAQSVLILELK